VSAPAPGPRVVAADELIEGWEPDVRTSFAYWVASHHPDLIDAYDALIRRLESAQRDRFARTGSSRP
jgi:hypothetical protein